MLEGSATPNADLKGQLAAIGRLARESALRVRETVWVVNAKYDTLSGLVTKMRDTADTMLAGHVVLRFPDPVDLPDRKIDMELRQAVYLTFKETLQNVIKHAEASAVDIHVAYEHPRLTVRVRDDGKGCDWSRPSSGNGVGLMRERVAKHGGEVVFSGGPGIGTTMSASVRVR